MDIEHHFNGFIFKVFFQPATFALGNQPYIEVGFGIGNIFKLMRVDAIERFSYLNHPMVPRYGIRFQLKSDY